MKEHSEIKYSGFGEIHNLNISVNGKELQREVYHLGDAVAVIVIDEEFNIFCVKQFRPGIFFNEGRRESLEIVAGMCEEGLTLEQVALKEIKEEIGYSVKELTKIYSFYSSPGVNSEKMTLFFAMVDEKIAEGGGREDEDEDIEVVKVHINDALEMTYTGEIDDAKTIIGIQMLALQILKQGILEKNK